MNNLPLFFLLFFLACNSSHKDGNTDLLSGGHVPVYPEMPPAADGSDPLASFAWHLDNVGQSAFASRGGIAGEDLNVKPVYRQGLSGHGIRIAVSDSGVETSHPDLYDNALLHEHRNYSGPPSEWHGSEPVPEDGEGHGTSVSGLIAALWGNGIGSHGVAPEAHFAGFYFIGSYRDNTSSYEARVLDQLTGEFDIFNYSYGYPGCSFFEVSQDVIDAYKNGVTTLRHGLGAIYVKAAGNEYQGYNSSCYPGDNSFYWGNTNTGEDQNHPYLILVAASNARGEISSYSSPGSGNWITSTGGEFGSSDPAMITTDMQGCSDGLSVSSSGVSAFNRGASSYNPNCSYTNAMNGTSSAAPTLAGVVALMLEANANLSWRDVKHILATTAEPIKFSTSSMSHPAGANLAGHTYDQVYTINAAGFKYSNIYGFGRVDAQKAVAAAESYNFPLGRYLETETNGIWKYRSGTLNLSIPDNSASGVSHAQAVTENLKIESVQIKVTIEHPFIGNVGVELISPSGTKGRLLRINSNIKDRGLYDYTLLTNAFYGERSAGNWTIKVIDGAYGNTGKLTSWELKVNGAQ
jgi:hypothetical protein